MQPSGAFSYLWYYNTKHMKKLAFILAMSFLGTLAVQAVNPVSPVAQSIDQIIYAKVINNTAAAFEYKVGTDMYTIAVGESAGFAFEENTQIMRKDANGVWINWFVFSNSYANQSWQLSDLMNN